MTFSVPSAATLNETRHVDAVRPRPSIGMLTTALLRLAPTWPYSRFTKVAAATVTAAFSTTAITLEPEGFTRRMPDCCAAIGPPVGPTPNLSHDPPYRFPPPWQTGC